jgi:hypothetical protein
MSEPHSLPPFEVTDLQPIAHVGHRGVRLEVALRPEHFPQVTDVAVHLVERYARDNMTVAMVFQPAPTRARPVPKALRARYVRDDIHRRPDPMPLSAGRRVVTIKLPRGVLTVEQGHPS